MTYEEWFNSYVARNGKIIEGLARADAWDAAYIEGQKAMRESAAQHSFDVWNELNNGHECAESIRALPIEGE